MPKVLVVTLGWLTWSSDHRDEETAPGGLVNMQRGALGGGLLRLEGRGLGVGLI